MQQAIARPLILVVANSLSTMRPGLDRRFSMACKAGTQDRLAVFLRTDDVRRGL